MLQMSSCKINEWHLREEVCGNLIENVVNFKNFSLIKTWGWLRLCADCEVYEMKFNQ